MIDTVVGKEIHVSENQSDTDVESAAARRLAEALAPSAIIVGGERAGHYHRAA